MKKLFVSLFFLVFLVSCTKKEKTIIVNTQNADGLTTETKLNVNGLEIGQVVDINLAKDGSVNLICEINNTEIEIPVDSKFYLKNLGLLGGKTIGIEMGSENAFIERGMSVKLAEQGSPDIEDEFSKAMKKVMSVFSGQHNTDSLLYELRRLNKNMEELNTRRQE